jgi:phospholipid/cholesterol/gamma-HCH transport system permease protein
MKTTPAPPSAEWREEAGGWLLVIRGDWHRDGPQPKIQAAPKAKVVPDRYDCADLGGFDSTLPAHLLSMIRAVEDREAGAEASLEGLPDNLHGLMELALGVPEQSEAKARGGEGGSLLSRVRGLSRRMGESVLGVVEFTGLTVLSLARFATGRARFRRAELWLTIQECGAQALPIVSLISFLIGMILAFVGGYQLAGFGAEIFVADLVGIAMVREMGVVMTGIIMSGRTGAAFAAHIGSMKANEEIDALRTFGLNPFDFLVLPRVIALVIMMPLLTVYANLVGILGGMLVGAASGLPAVLYWQQTLTAIDLTTASLGVFKSVFFGVAIAMCGCLQGMKAESSSAGVGLATTRAVVASITAVIVLDSAFAAIFTILDI